MSGEGGSPDRTYPCDGWREDARADDDPAKRMGLGRTDDRLEFEPKIRKSENPKRKSTSRPRGPVSRLEARG